MGGEVETRSGFRMLPLDVALFEMDIESNIRRTSEHGGENGRRRRVEASSRRLDSPTGRP